MNSTIPVIMVQHTLGIKGLLNGAYHFNKTEASIQKRFWISTLGSLDVLGKTERYGAPFPTRYSLSIMPTKPIPTARKPTI
jgi:hypothetical protein